LHYKNFLYYGQSYRRPCAHGNVLGGFWSFAAEKSARKALRIFLKKNYGGFNGFCGGFKTAGNFRRKI
jgi:hypothetical protein